MHQGNTYIFGEYRGKIDKLNYRLGVAMTRFYYNQSGKDKSTESYSFNPSIVLHYAMSDNSYLRWKGNIYNASPSLGDLSDVEQAVDSFQIRRGNPNLKSYMCYHTELTYEWKKGIFYTNLWGAYDYRPNAIMDEKIQEGNKIVQTWDNQKDWQKLSGRAMLRVGPIRDILQFSFTGGVNHYMSHGNHYSHTYTNWFCEAEASLNYKQFSLFWQINTNWNNFWGETLSGGENQRVKLAYFLSIEKAQPTIFVFDEPTTGLHFHDIKKLLEAFDALISRGHTLVIIEHNMDVIKCADHVIDLGPEGGDMGGNLVATGTPEEVAKCAASYTGQYLAEKLNQ